MSLNEKTWIEIAVMGAGVLILLLGSGVLRGLGGFLVAAGFAMNFAWNRCPHCGEWLGKYPGKHCKACGAEIDYKAGR